MAYYPSLGDQIRKQMEDKDITARFLSSRLYHDLGFPSAKAAENYICLFRKGSLYGSTSSRAVRKPHNMERLSKLLYAMDMEEDSIIIHDIRSLDPRFVYPPANGVSANMLAQAAGTLEEKV